MVRFFSFLSALVLAAMTAHAQIGAPSPNYPVGSYPGFNFQIPVVVVTSNYQLKVSDRLVAFNCSSLCVVTLPDCLPVTGTYYQFVVINQPINTSVLLNEVVTSNSETFATGTAFMSPQSLVGLKLLSVASSPAPGGCVWVPFS